MRTATLRRTLALSVIAVFGLVASACVPPTSGPPPVDWAFEGTEVTVLNSQDETCVLGICVNSNDEPYLLNINFRVTIGQPGSAVAWRTGSSSNEYNDLGAGESHGLVGAERARATFNGIKPLTLESALNPNNKMTVVGSYAWAMESDAISYDGAADDVAEIFEDALNATLAPASLPSSEEALIDLILDLLFNNVGNAFSVLLANIPLFGLGDDALGGAVYIGVGASGALGDAINAILGGYSIPTLNLLGDNKIPPKIVGGGIYTLTGSKSFTQNFSGAGGIHNYDFLAGPA